jgi:hypothetical protein
VERQPAKAADDLGGAELAAAAPGQQDAPVEGAIGDRADSRA